jgi:hypothetical protein
MKGFVRLKPLGPFVLYGYLKPRHETGGHICSYFARRSPFTIIVLGNNLKSWISLFNSGAVFLAHGCGLKQTLDEVRGMGMSDFSEGDLDLEDVWRVYYSSQYSPERRNILAFNRRMPERSLDSAGLEVEQNKNGLTLKDFFGSV